MEDPVDENTAAIRSSLGGSTELVKTTQMSRIWGGRLEDLAAIVHFMDSGVTATPMVPDQHYTRDEFEVCRPAEPHMDTHWVATKVCDDCVAADVALW